MPLYFFKPVVWNDNGYQRPGGAAFTSGYPKEHGYGHEEWNNSTQLEFKRNGERLRIFYTQGVGKQPLDEYKGSIFVYMIASHKGAQWLVAVAGQATSLFGDEKERRHIVRLIRKPEWNEAWQLPSVQRAYQNNKGDFREHWNNEPWLPTWVCPADSYLGLRTPVLLNSMALTGRERLITMYASYQEIDRSIASRVLDVIPTGENRTVLAKLKSLCTSDAQDIREDLQRLATQSCKETTRRALVDARLGQGHFRDQLSGLWDDRCAVTGCATAEVLRASHVKPWRHCNNAERLDPHNGLLLGAHLDALFDTGLITFDDNGSMLISSRISNDDRQHLRLGGGLKKSPPAALKQYLAYHRRYVAKDIQQ